jgi:D-alanyl-D-alanine carboxypeptidase
MTETPSLLIEGPSWTSHDRSRLWSWGDMLVVFAAEVNTVELALRSGRLCSGGRLCQVARQ